MMDVYALIENFLREKYPWLELMSCEKNGAIIYFHYGVPFLKFEMGAAQMVVTELFKKTGSEIVLRK